MHREILCVRVSRRAIGVVILRADGLILSDGRHLPSSPTRAVSAATRYLERVVHPSTTVVVIDSPARGISAATDRLLDGIHAVLVSKGLPPLVIDKHDVLAAYALHPLRTRAELRTVVGGYWPALEQFNGRVKPYVIDAAATALYAECRLALNPQPT